MRGSVIAVSIMVLATTHCAWARPAPEKPVVLPEKYAPEKYANLAQFERERCDRYVKELTLIEKRKQLGLNPGDAQKMQARITKIDHDYDRYCLKILVPEN